MGEMQIYTFNYSGAYLGGVVVVIADSLEHAEASANADKAMRGFAEKPLELKTVMMITNGCVAYGDSGDY